MLFILHPGKQYPVSIISQISKPMQFITKTVFKPGFTLSPKSEEQEQARMLLTLYIR